MMKLDQKLSVATSFLGVLAILSIIAALPWSIFVYIPIVGYPFSFVLAGVLGILLITDVLVHKRIAFPSIFGAIILVASLVALSRAWTLYPEVWRRELAWWIISFISFLGTLQFFDTRCRVRAFALFCCVGAMLTFPQLTLGLYEIAGNAYAVPGHNPNITAYILVGWGYAIMLTMLVMEVTRLERGIFLVSIALIALEVFMLGSRASQVAILLSFFVFVFADRIPHLVRVFGCLLLGGLALAAPTGFFLELLSVVDVATHESSPMTSIRGELWPEAIKLFTQSPVLGIGPGSFPFLSASGLNVHNVFLEVLVSFGVAGVGVFFIFMSTIWFALRSGVQHQYLSKIVLLYFSAMLPVLSTGHIANVPVTWVVIAFTLCIVRLVHSEESMKSDRALRLVGRLGGE